MDNEPFIDNYKNGKITIIKEQEAPDFIVRPGENEFGIELTEVFQDSHISQSRLKQNSSSGSSFTQDLIALIQPDVQFTFSIGIHFNKNQPLRKAKVPAILKRLRDACVPAMVNLKDHEHLDLENYYDNLPEEIDKIHIYRFDSMDESFDSRPE